MPTPERWQTRIGGLCRERAAGWTRTSPALRLADRRVASAGLQPSEDGRSSRWRDDVASPAPLQGVFIHVTGHHRCNDHPDKMNTFGDLQGGLEEAERLLGYSVTRKAVTEGS